MKKHFFTVILTLHLSLFAFAQTENNICPKFLDSIEHLQAGILVYSIKTDKKSELTYKWSVEDGTILYGNNTNNIVVLTEVNSIKVKLEIDGLPETCREKTFSSSTTWDPPHPQIIDKYNKITEAQERQRLENFLLSIASDRESKAIFKLKEAKELIAHIKFLNSFLKELLVDRTRIFFAVTAKSDFQTELTMVPNGAYMPNCKDCLTFASQDFEKIERLFQTKPIAKKRKI